MSRIGLRHRLPDGRVIGYDDHGPLSGRPVFLFHGTPNSRYDWYYLGDENLAWKLGLRVIAPDRPGVGLSDEQPGRRILDWPADVANLADALGLGRFAVVAYSGGAPYAAACARLIPERLAAAGIISGTGPDDSPGTPGGMDPLESYTVSLARFDPRLAEAILSLLGMAARRLPPRLFAEIRHILPPADREALSRPRIQQVLVDAFAEAVRPGPRGARLDTALMIGPWGFALQDIALPVLLWHGEADNVVPPETARFVEGALPAGRLRLFPAQGHVSLIVNHGEEMLSELATA